MILSAFAIAPLLVAQASFAVDAAWYGDWKLSPALSRLVGPTTIIKRADGGYHFDFGAVAFRIGDDGKDYPTVPNRSTSLKQIGSNEWFRVHKINGKAIDRSTLKVTSLGKTLLIHTVATELNGTTRVSDETLLRVGSGSGLAGIWQSTTAGADVPTTLILKASNHGRLRFQYPGQAQFYGRFAKWRTRETARPSRCSRSDDEVIDEVSDRDALDRAYSRRTV